jgi:hypothetical protein
MDTTLGAAVQAATLVLVVEAGTKAHQVYQDQAAAVVVAVAISLMALAVEAV